MSRLFIAPAAFAVAMTLAGPAVAVGGGDGGGGGAGIGGEAVAGQPGEDGSMAVTAVPPEASANANVNGIQELSRVASGMQINFGDISTQTAIRGRAPLTHGYGGRMSYRF